MSSQPSDPQNLKRRRLDLDRAQTSPDTETLAGSSQPKSSLEFQEDSHVWASDGTIILVCQLPVLRQPRIGFRVYKGLLAQHCEVFRDMFATCDASGSMSHADTITESYKGCPVVVVHDKPEDMRRFLKYIMDKNYGKDVPSLGLKELASLLRMSTKYGFPSLRSEIITRLQAIYPSRLDDFQPKKINSKAGGITGINLGLECDVPSIIPAAYYLCSNVKLTELYQDALGALNGESSEEEEELLAVSKIPSVEKFSSEFDHTVVFVTLFEGALVCQCDCKLEGCRAIWPKYLSQQDVELQTRRWRCNFFDKESILRETRVCEDCAAKLMERRRIIQRKVWDEMPHFCGLKDWDKICSKA